MREQALRLDPTVIDWIAIYMRMMEQIYRRARAQYGDLGGEMLPMKLYEDLTGTPLRLPPGASLSL